MSGDRGDTENDRGESRLSATRGVPERRAAPGRALLARISANAHAYVESTGGKPPLRVLSVVLIALLMVTSLAAPIGMAAGAASGPPDGMTGVPADNVGPPDNAQGNGPGAQGGGDLPDAIPTDAAAWSIHASEHAGDLGVEIDAVDDELVLRLSDERNHDGREVAVDRATLVEAVGHEPEAAFGLHESGERWTSEIEYSDGYATFEVPKFSTNDVTFTSAIEITGSPAADGATFGYEIEDGESIDSFEIALTGATNTAEDSTAATLNDGGSTTIDVGGTTAPEDATITLTGIDGAEITATDNTMSDPRSADVGEEYVAYGLASAHGLRSLDDGSRPWYPESHDYNDGGVALIEAHGLAVYGVGDNTEAGNYLIARSIADGSEEWTFDAAGSSDYIEDVSADADLVIASDRDGRMWALDPATGAEEWSRDSYDPLARAQTNGLGETVAVFADRVDNDVAAVDRTDGSVEWEIDLPDAEHVAVVDGQIAISSGSELVVLDASDGSELTRTELGTAISDVDADADAIAVVAGDEIRTFDWGLTEGATYDVSDSSEADDEVEAASIDGPDLAWFGDDRSVTIYYTGVTTDPAVEVEGVEELSHTGELGDGETVSEPVSLEPGTSTVSLSTTDGLADVSIDWTEVTESVDPRVEVNGELVAEHSGTLADGETVTIDADETAVVEGQNDVTVAVSESAGGPSGQVGLDYSHRASINQSTSYEGETWSERYEVSREWADDRAEAQLEIPFASDRVVSIRDVELQRDGGDWEPVSDEQYSLDGTKLTVALGDVAAGETTAIRANASKVVVDEGAIEVTEPTVAGDTLDSEIEIVETGADGAGVEIDVTGTVEDSYTHYAHEPSWADADPHAVVEASGTQTLVLAEANAGSTTQVRTLPLAPAPETGEVELRIEDADTPRFTLSPGASEGDTVELGWYDTISGERYVLVDADSDLELDGDRASSPVWFTTDDSGTVLIEQRDSDGGEPVVGPATSGGDGPIPPWSLLLIGVAVSVTGLWGVSRRFGGDERAVRGNALVLVGGAAVALVAVELSTAESAIALMVGAVIDSVAGALGSAAASAAGTIVVGLGILVGLWLLDQRTEREVPTWLVVLGGAVTTLWIVETIAPGALTEPLASGLDEVGPLVWLALLGGGGWLGYRYVQARGEPDTEVTLELGGEP